MWSAQDLKKAFRLAEDIDKRQDNMIDNMIMNL